jgi:hypothetical protein
LDFLQKKIWKNEKLVEIRNRTNTAMEKNQFTGLCSNITFATTRYNNGEKINNRFVKLACCRCRRRRTFKLEVNKIIFQVHGN